jgi:HPt (histidine-containing phosphotransfer) domain-containing protein
MSDKAEAAQKIQAMLKVMWKSSRPTIAERLRTLRVAQQKIAEGALDEAVRKEAESAAHKLAGILGTFGLPEGGAAASKIDRLLARPGEIEAHQPDLASWLDELESQIASRDQSSDQ